LKVYRKSAIILLFGLVVLTVLACLPYAPQGPFDARSYTRLAGMRVEHHPWTTLIEPFFAPLLIIGGAPNFLVAAVSVLLWVFLGAGAWGMVAEIRARKKKRPFGVALAGMQSALIGTSSLLLLLFLFVIARVPGWRLVLGDPNVIVADLHTHTVISHDGLVSLRTNLEWHASCGYDMEALTEHDNLAAHKIPGESPSEAARLPAFLSGLEVHAGPGAMALGICRNTDLKLGPTADTASFMKQIHQGCGGAVFILPLKNLTAAHIAQLADDGVDGFEIANCGHPGLPPKLRRELLATCRARGLILLADTDWHGWSGLTRTWNVIKVAGASGLSPAKRAEAVLDKLRAHDTADFIPVVAGTMGQPSRARAVFAPIVETVRYGMELSPARVISWWAWAWAVFGLWIWIEKKGFRPGDILPALLVSTTSVFLILAGIWQAMQGMGTTRFGFHGGLITIGVGLIALAIAVVRGMGFLREPGPAPWKHR
jgi:hypothetical protein